MLTGGDLVVASLAAHGVDVVFGIPGTHNLPIYAALHGSGIRHVTPRHEQGAGYAADGYARTTGRPGVAIVTTGPALLNIAAAVGQAYSDSIPMLVISPGMPLDHRAGSGLLHEAKDQSAAMAAVALRSHRVTSVAEIPAAIARAFTDFGAARPGPIHLEIPLDLLAATGDAVTAPPIVVPPRHPDPTAIRTAAEMLSAAVRPAMIVGGGARRSAVVALAERLAAPVYSTINGKGTVPDDHPLAVTAALHLPAVAEQLDHADVVLAIGTELAPTDFWNGAPRWTAPLIRVDADPARLTVNAAPAIAIVADASLAVDELLRQIRPPAPGTDHVARVLTAERAATAESAAARVASLRADVTAQARVEARRWLPWLDAIDAVLDRDAIIVADNAMSCYYGALGRLTVRRPAGFCFPAGFGTLGYAVPAGIGAKIANPGARVIAISGDGGLMFSVQELATAAAERVSLPIVVFDNGGYGEIRAEMHDAGMVPLGVELPVPHWVDLAKALGGHGAAPRTPAELTDELTAAFARPGPTLLAIKEPT
jgi:thiamine pyrophosphate-dependent acetolactate synthase large subunit-like protein